MHTVEGKQRKFLTWLVAGMLLASIAPLPMIDTWRVEYQKVDPNVSLNYQSIGSGGGINQFTQKTVDFGASDAPLTQQEMQALSSSSSTPVHIPETIGSV